MKLLKTMSICLQPQTGTCQECCQRLHQGICHLQRLNPPLLQLWAFSNREGDQGGLGHSALQGVGWNRHLEGQMISGTDFMMSILAFFHM